MTKVTHLTLDERGSLSRKRIHLREISGDADAPLETVGQDLRAARLRRGDDLATVSRALKIRKDHLEALEEDRFEALPGKAYAIGFVRSYADYLGIDPLQCVERFKGEIAGRTEVQPTIGPPPEAETVRLPQGWLVIGVVILIVVFYGAYHLMRSADTMLRQPVATVPVRMAPTPSPITAIVTPKPAVAAPPASVAGPAAAPNGPGMPSTAPDAGSVPGAAPPMATQPGVAVQGQQAIVPSPGSQPQAMPALPPGRVFNEQIHNARVVLKVLKPTRIIIQSPEGGVVFNRLLQPGDSYLVPNRVGLTLTTPDGGAVGVELDGQPMGSAGAQSHVTEALSLDPQAIVDRYNRSNPG
jgi:cytoskeleton protein RodZ